MSHIINLVKLIPDLKNRPILDIGAGRGAFVVDATLANFDITGLEFNPKYIKLAHDNAKYKNIPIKIIEGVAEKLPFSNNTFGFINLSEVIEHVDNPEIVMSEAYRVLMSGGKVYLSVPNRYSARDPHFHLYGVNWIPRSFSDIFISMFGKHKNYTDKSTGEQRLSDMHYYTFEHINKLLNKVGFCVSDIRIIRITEEFTFIKRIIAKMIYPIFRTLYFDSFHLLLTKK